MKEATARSREEVKLGFSIAFLSEVLCADFKKKKQTNKQKLPALNNPNKQTKKKNH